MNDPSMLRTSPSLLDRLRQETRDHAAWSEFVRRYGAHILKWCRKWHLQDADAEDVTQTVQVKLADKMQTFAYDPSRRFRGYLKTLTNYALCDYLEARKRQGAAAGGSVALDILQTVEAREDLVQHLHGAFDQELLEEAMKRVQARVESHTWEAFLLTAIEGAAGTAVAEQLGIKIATVYKARSKVQQMLQVELRALDDPQT